MTILLCKHAWMPHNQSGFRNLWPFSLYEATALAKGEFSMTRRSLMKLPYPKEKDSAEKDNDTFHYYYCEFDNYYYEKIDDES